MDIDSIKAVLSSPAGKALKDYLMLKLETLKDIDNLDGTVVDLKAQKKAYKKVKEILTEIITFSEPVKVKDKRDSYDIL